MTRSTAENSRRILWEGGISGHTVFLFCWAPDAAEGVFWWWWQVLRLGRPVAWAAGCVALRSSLHDKHTVSNCMVAAKCLHLGARRGWLRKAASHYVCLTW